MSISAKMAVAVLRAFKKIDPRKGPDPETEIPKARAYNRKHAFRGTERLGRDIRVIRVGAYPCLFIEPKTRTRGASAGPGGKIGEQRNVILFLHGGGDRDAWRPEVGIARTYAKRAGQTVIYPLYPAFTDVGVSQTADELYEVYRALAQRYGARQISVVGDSYGGFLAVQLVSWINRRAEGTGMSRILILNSPYAFPKTAEERALAEDYETTDPMVPVGATRYMLQGVWDTDPQTPAYAIYPADMDLRDAPETVIYYTEETCYAAAGAIRAAYERGGCAGRLRMHMEPGMMHCYACAPVFPESRRDFGEQIRLLREDQTDECARNDRGMEEPAGNDRPRGA